MLGTGRGPPAGQDARRRRLGCSGRRDCYMVGGLGKTGDTRRLGLGCARGSPGAGWRGCQVR